MKKTLTILAVLLLVAGAVVLTAKHYHQSPGSTRPSVPVTQPGVPTVPTQPSSPTVPAIKPNTPGGRAQSRTDVRAAAKAAAAAMRKLSLAQFMPAAQAQQIVNSTVIPELRSPFEQRLHASAALIAAQMGYESVAEAQTHADYYVTALSYKVDSFKNGAADIRLYYFAHFKVHENLGYVERLAPDIRIVRMKWLKGHWLYVKTYDPPVSQIPVPQIGLSLQQTVAAFQPYIIGFKGVSP